MRSCNIKRVILGLMFMSCVMLQGKSNLSCLLVIDVYPGPDTSICNGGILDISILGAHISGDVSDGTWFTTGDGTFDPSGTDQDIFSITSHYQPGPSDYSNSFVDLILVSDDPDGNGPLTEESDIVRIHFQSAPAMVCYNNLNISLDAFCQEQLAIDMLLSNPISPLTNYRIESFDENDDLILDNILTSDHRGQTISFGVSHLCGSNSCWGELKVLDKLAPSFICSDVTISCSQDSSPDSVGFPLPIGVVITPIDDKEYEVVNFDSCGMVELSYSEGSNPLDCSTGYETVISRTWVAEDESGNVSVCNQSIYIMLETLASVTFPPNYDDSDEPSLECMGGVWTTLLNGNPHPSYTGYPSTDQCSNLESTFDDLNFENCGSGFKVLRSWTVIDWCNAGSLSHNQVIKVADNITPEILCPLDLVLPANGYECRLIYHEVDVPSVSDACSAYSVSAYLIDINNNNIDLLIISNGFVQLNDIVLGDYLLRFIALDECNNADTCNLNLSIVDQTPPFTVCDGFTKVALGEDGKGRLYANSLDDGSHDNCSIDRFEVAKMTDFCGFGLGFGEFVEFCCEEKDSTIMVALRVWDIHGNYNDCMVEATVEDKLPPIPTCPDDVTISCDYSFDIDDLSEFGTMNPNNRDSIFIYDQYNQGFAGLGSTFIDNCGATFEESAVSSIDCFIGNVIRTFIVTDESGNSSSCNQVITIVNPDPFDEDDIEWPVKFESSGCDMLLTDPSITGEPVLSNIYCATANHTFSDKVFNIVDSACVKVVRKWSVIDWCQYDDDTGFGLWEYTQVIKLINTEAPTFLSSCKDTTVCLSQIDDCMGTAVLGIDAIDDCTPDSLINYTWRIDLNGDGIFDQDGIGNELSEELSPGNYLIKWTAEDNCGNLSSCQYLVEVKECKAPTLYCESAITTVLMPTTGEMELWASDFDRGSSDNCTATEDLIFSFSKDTSDVVRTYNCDSLINGMARTFVIEMWATDEAVNQEYCIINLTIQDNQDACTDSTTKGDIQGLIATQEGIGVSNVVIDYYSSVEQFDGATQSDSDGNYDIDDIPAHLFYDLVPRKNTNHNQAVSVLDLILIKKHILGIKPFTSPYDLIAADVNGSESISGVDLLEMQRLILGFTSEFNGNESWRFVDERFEFSDPDNPWTFKEEISLRPLSAPVLDANFIGVKIGDVNGSYDGFSQNMISSRSENSLILQIEETRLHNGYTHVEFKASESLASEGIQLGLVLNSISGIEEVRYLGTTLDDSSYKWDSRDATLKLIAYQSESSTIIPGEVVVELMVKGNISVSDMVLIEGFSTIVESGNSIRSIELEFHSNEEMLESNDKLFEVINNPCKSTCMIKSLIKSTDNLTIELFNSNGAVVQSWKDHSPTLGSQINLHLNEGHLPGIYYIRGFSNGRSQTDKVLVSVGK